ncbi:MAG: hypothetical protein RLZZ606_81 [Actinomycetota bacterium]|jgi:hypothetical protein
MKPIKIKSKFGRLLTSLLITVLLVAFFMEALYVSVALLPPNDGSVFLPIIDIPLLYFVTFYAGSNQVIEIFVALFLWLAYWVTVVYLRLSQQYRGVKFSFLMPKYLVSSTLLLAVITLSQGMYGGAVMMLLIFPVFMFVPLKFPLKR